MYKSIKSIKGSYSKRERKRKIKAANMKIWKKERKERKSSDTRGNEMMVQEVPRHPKTKRSLEKRKVLSHYYESVFMFTKKKKNYLIKELLVAWTFNIDMNLINDHEKKLIKSFKHETSA